MYKNYIRCVTANRSLFVSFKKLKYSYSLEHPHATPHADTSADTIRATIPFHRNFSNIPLYTFPGGGRTKRQRRQRRFFLFLARCPASRTWNRRFVSLRLSLVASPRDRKYSYRRRNSRSSKSFCLCCLCGRSSVT